LEKDLKKLGQRRSQRRGLRSKKGIPVLSLIGYTNAGKTTLFNLLTGSQFLVEDRLFATLDTATRRLRFPEAREVVITDTVGLIRDLPKDLIGAFRATFDELQESDLLIHLVDMSDPSYEEHIRNVEGLLEDLGLDSVPRLLVFNKEDCLDRTEAEAISRKHGAISLSAHRPESLPRLVEAIARKFGQRNPPAAVTVDKGDPFGIPSNHSDTSMGEIHGRPIKEDQGIPDL
jgi:GTP-binding protein HflX